MTGKTITKKIFGYNIMNNSEIIMVIVLLVMLLFILDIFKQSNPYVQKLFNNKLFLIFILLIFIYSEYYGDINLVFILIFAIFFVVMYNNINNKKIEENFSYIKCMEELGSIRQ
jgi:hypothetical protein